jgi:hypothetical protein
MSLSTVVHYRYGDEALSDVVIKSREVVFHVHAACMSSYSTYLRDRIQEKKAEPVLEVELPDCLQDIPVRLLEVFFEYSYDFDTGLPFFIEMTYEEAGFDIHEENQDSQDTIDWIKGCVTLNDYVLLFRIHELLVAPRFCTALLNAAVKTACIYTDLTESLDRYSHHLSAVDGLKALVAEFPIESVDWIKMAGLVNRYGGSDDQLRTMISAWRAWTEFVETHCDGVVEDDQPALTLPPVVQAGVVAAASVLCRTVESVIDWVPPRSRQHLMERVRRVERELARYWQEKRVMSVSEARGAKRKRASA